MLNIQDLTQKKSTVKMKLAGFHRVIFNFFQYIRYLKIFRIYLISLNLTDCYN